MQEAEKVTLNDQEVAANNKEIHHMCFERMLDIQKSFVSLNTQYIGHVLTLSLGILSLAIPLLLKNEVLI